MSELRMPVWQFVRLMVQVEDSLKAVRGRKKPPLLQDLYNAWDDTWLELDQRLAELGKNDPDAFAELMMRQDVVLTDATPRRKKTAVAEIKKVLTNMRAALKTATDAQAKEDLTFEIEELEDLLYDIEE